MHVAVFGGTRGVGKQVILQGLGLGHTITALARDPTKIEVQDNLLIVKGDATDQKSVDETIRGSQAVVLSLGVGIASDPAQLAVCSVATELVVKAMKRFKVRRLVVVSSMGVGDSFNDISERARTFLKPYLDDKEVQERCVVESELDWVIIRPAGLR
ncbi:hypothetical protein BC829DRAFT_401267 [Chytridium lagenaria]|nr:hypothetical protein BC829DRAFT_401267 [Chytridium lagenaria]